VKLHATAALLPRKEPPVPIDVSYINVLIDGMNKNENENEMKYEAGWTPEPVYVIWRRKNS
jgi:hypothetical protein